jgi:hypothetical protein
MPLHGFQGRQVKHNVPRKDDNARLAFLKFFLLLPIARVAWTLALCYEKASDKTNTQLDLRIISYLYRMFHYWAWD